MILKSFDVVLGSSIVVLVMFLVRGPMVVQMDVQEHSKRVIGVVLGGGGGFKWFSVFVGDSRWYFYNGSVVVLGWWF